MTGGNKRIYLPISEVFPGQRLKCKEEQEKLPQNKVIQRDDSYALHFYLMMSINLEMFC